MDDFGAYDAFDQDAASDVYAGTANDDPGFYSDGPDDDSIDFSRCPHCGAEPLEIASEEQLFASNHLKNIEVGDDGQLIKVEWGLTEVDYDSSRTLFYRCDSCFEALPRRYQAIIDELLQNEREEESK
jgi:hypothetical protein